MLSPLLIDSLFSTMSLLSYLREEVSDHPHLGESLIMIQEEEELDSSNTQTSFYRSCLLYKDGSLWRLQILSILLISLQIYFSLMAVIMLEQKGISGPLCLAYSLLALACYVSPVSFQVTDFLQGPWASLLLLIVTVTEIGCLLHSLLIGCLILDIALALYLSDRQILASNSVLTAVISKLLRRRKDDSAFMYCKGSDVFESI